MAYYGGLIMKGIVLGTTAGALIGVMIQKLLFLKVQKKNGML